jgi:hypothetical protein
MRVEDVFGALIAIASPMNKSVLRGFSNHKGNKTSESTNLFGSKPSFQVCNKT